MVELCFFLSSLGCVCFHTTVSSSGFRFQQFVTSVKDLEEKTLNLSDNTIHLVNSGNARGVVRFSAYMFGLNLRISCTNTKCSSLSSSAGQDRQPLSGSTSRFVCTLKLLIPSLTRSRQSLEQFWSERDDDIL